jgi:hypothetical protein
MTTKLANEEHGYSRRKALTTVPLPNATAPRRVESDAGTQVWFRYLASRCGTAPFSAHYRASSHASEAALENVEPACFLCDDETTGIA